MAVKIKPVCFFRIRFSRLKPADPTHHGRDALSGLNNERGEEDRYNGNDYTKLNNSLHRHLHFQFLLDKQTSGWWRGLVSGYWPGGQHQYFKPPIPLYKHY